MLLINIEVNHSNLTKKTSESDHEQSLCFAITQDRVFFSFLFLIEHFIKVQYVVCVEIYLQ